MQILLDFHLSDFWADPGRQWIPDAWAPVADDLPVLQDSLYNYIHGTLMAMHGRGLLPEMVQVGNETNRGILLPIPVNDAGWVLDWDRNGPLFQAGLQAVADVEAATGQSFNAFTAQRVLEPTGDRHGAAQRDVEVGQLVGGERRGRIDRGAGLADDERAQAELRVAAGQVAH